jgi:hypothetical protein
LRSCKAGKPLKMRHVPASSNDNGGSSGGTTLTPNIAKTTKIISGPAFEKAF